MGQFLHVKGQRRRGNAQAFGDLARGQPVGACFNQKPKDREPGFLGQGAEGADDRVRFHISIIIEMLADAKSWKSRRRRHSTTP